MGDPNVAPPAGVPGTLPPSISDEELTRRFTRSRGGPNPMYRCNGCGYEEYGVRNLLVAHAATCGVVEAGHQSLAPSVPSVLPPMSEE